VGDAEQNSEVVGEHTLLDSEVLDERDDDFDKLQEELDDEYAAIEEVLKREASAIAMPTAQNSGLAGDTALVAGTAHDASFTFTLSADELLAVAEVVVHLLAHGPGPVPPPTDWADRRLGKFRDFISRYPQLFTRRRVPGALHVELVDGREGTIRTLSKARIV